MSAFHQFNSYISYHYYTLIPFLQFGYYNSHMVMRLLANHRELKDPPRSVTVYTIIRTLYSLSEASYSVLIRPLIMGPSLKKKLTTKAWEVICYILGPLSHQKCFQAQPLGQNSAEHLKVGWPTLWKFVFWLPIEVKTKKTPSKLPPSLHLGFKAVSCFVFE